jgi:hypothetical protein
MYYTILLFKFNHRQYMTFLVVRYVTHRSVKEFKLHSFKWIKIKQVALCLLPRLTKRIR